MRPSNLPFFLLALPPILGSFVVLTLASVGRSLWITHLIAIAVACVLALASNRISKLVNRQMAASAIIFLTFIVLLIPLLGNSLGPERWISLGPFRLYVAPILLPSFIAACSAFVSKGNIPQIVSLISVVSVAILLALQPDASQVLGLVVASAVIVTRYKLGAFRLAMIFLPMLLVAVGAFSMPDPLVPVPYVEEVFALALGHSLFAGIAVIASALALIVGFWIKSFNGPVWLSAVAAYYAALFACSIAGHTPAPLVGYGAGPILGFGLMLGFLRWIEPQSILQTNTDHPRVGEMKR